MKYVFYFIPLIVFFVGCGSSDSSGTNPVSKNTRAAQTTDYLEEGIEDLRQHNLKKAVEEFHLAIQQDPKDVDAYLMLAKLSMEMKAYESSIKYFTAAANLRPDDGHIYLSLAKCYDLAGNKEEAINNLKKSAVIFKGQNDENNYKISLAFLSALMNEEKGSVQ